ncbi:hypothetical protein ACQFYA_21270 [Promicromonospora sp. Marseille-Q5078]
MTRTSTRLVPALRPGQSWEPPAIAELIAAADEATRAMWDAVGAAREARSARRRAIKDGADLDRAVADHRAAEGALTRAIAGAVIARTDARAAGGNLPWDSTVDERIKYPHIARAVGAQRAGE